MAFHSTSDLSSGTVSSTKQEIEVFPTSRIKQYSGNYLSEQDIDLKPSLLPRLSIAT